MIPSHPASDFPFEDCAPAPGSRTVCWLCSYTPEELLLAAGFASVRIGAGEKPPSGVAKNVGVVRAIERALGTKLALPPEPQLVGAIGAALIAREG